MKSILVTVVPEETKLAILEDDKLSSIEVERATHSHLVGNIYKGQVQNVLPGMQAAFVDIGTGKNAFMYIGDGLPEDVKQTLPRPQKIHIGQHLPVQIIKDAIGSKGPRATTHITLPGRHVVLLPTAAYIGMSRRIEDEAERTRLHDIAAEICPEGMGLIIRTVAAGASREALREDVEYLAKLWHSLMARFKIKSKGANILYRDADLIIRIVRDNLTPDVDAMLIDDRAVYQRVREFVQLLSPELVEKIRFYESREPLFKHYGIEEELATLGGRTVELKSGGFLVIDRTEALTVIDVNTGKYTGNTNLGETVYATNQEAAAEIMRQLRLRDIGGIIIVDFIDMEREAQKEQLLAHLRELAKLDPTKTNIVDITSLGLVEITRKKSRQNLDSIIYSECPICRGRGRVESPETVSIRIAGDVRRMEHKSHAEDGYEIEVHESVAEELRHNQLLMNLAAEFAMDIKVTAVPGMHPENYAINMMHS
ncbi:MAG: Rne/Rng family ribonuclease [Selenomonas sp.]|uniref:Rne/Rng family ribonuclease n=1 Tax=Selenomonas sp. TaxID=2053611 RepID=UPI0025CBA373|nr:Rne/Rng family ribonuclease [Selenomonas sp.]MCR5758168.1 Rne/Rng family ribonuclease [Selenomonas sp.]